MGADQCTGIRRCPFHILSTTIRETLQSGTCSQIDALFPGLGMMIRELDFESGNNSNDSGREVRDALFEQLTYNSPSNS